MATAKKSASGSGTPTWVAVVGAIVALSGAIYVWFNHFSPRVDPPKTPAAAAPGPQTSASVSVSGSGAVGVGVMSGGTINVGAPPAKTDPGAPSASASR